MNDSRSIVVQTFHRRRSVVLGLGSAVAALSTPAFVMAGSPPGQPSPRSATQKLDVAVVSQTFF